MERRKKGLISEYKMGRIQKLLKRLWYTRKGRLERSILDTRISGRSCTKKKRETKRMYRK